MLKLFSWNINGLRACLSKQGLQSLIAEHQPDILCLQEIKAQSDQLQLDEFNDYQIIWNSAERKGYSGTMVWSKQSIINSSTNFSQDIASQFKLIDEYGDSNREGRLITLEFANFYVVTVYTPNSKGDLSRLKLRSQAWDSAFLKHCQLLKKDKPVLMSGDFNVAHQEIDLARPKENVGKHGFTVEERQGFDNLIASGFIDTFRHLHPQQTEAYTWWTHWQNARAKNVGWRIDYWLMSQELSPKLSAANIHPQIMGSDHCPISIEINL